MTKRSLNERLGFALSMIPCCRLRSANRGESEGGIFLYCVAIMVECLVESRASECAFAEKEAGDCSGIAVVPFSEDVGTLSARGEVRSKLCPGGAHGVGRLRVSTRASCCRLRADLRDRARAALARAAH
ncbi:MAG: hypothetical protein ABI556_09430, partial [Gemmatimonadales bacterium]